MKDIICENCKKLFSRYGNKAEHDQHRFCSNKCAGLRLSRQTHPNLIEDYFEIIDTKEKAYWLGFLYADGCINSRKDGTLVFCLKLSGKDEDQIDRFITAVGANLEKKKTKKDRDRFTVSVEIGNRVFCQYLINSGCVPRKTLVIDYPKLGSEELDLSFLLGYFDGDGCIGSGKYIKPTLHSGSFSFLQSVVSRYNLTHLIMHKHTKGGVDGRVIEGECFSLYIGRNLYEKMLNSYECSMPRKRRTLPNSKSTRRLVEWDGL